MAVLRWLKALLTGLLALVILFEEWGWEPLQRAVGRLARLKLVAALERRIAALPPYAALAVFALPALLLLPVKIVALWVIGQGHAVFGALVIVVAKVAGTAIVARLFLLTKPSLMQLAWFAALYTRWVAWKDAVLARVRASSAWRAAREIKRAVRRRWESWSRAVR
jgi:hypothetical protein